MSLLSSVLMMVLVFIARSHRITWRTWSFEVLLETSSSLFRSGRGRSSSFPGTLGS